MATYKVLQDIEAEDKLVGPLTLWQFIYAIITGVAGYLSVIVVMKHVPVLLGLLVPIALFAAFLAIPWKSDQPTEVWAVAKLRFFLKPRTRVWSQDGMTDLVTITVPKKVERVLTDGLSQHEVRSRLSALANTLDSRGWIVKNVNVNLSSPVTAPVYAVSDRLVDVSSQPQEVAILDIRPDDDILDEFANPVAQKFGDLMSAAAADYHNALIARLNNVATPPPAQSGVTNWFTPQHTDLTNSEVITNDNTPVTTAAIPIAATPTKDEEILIAEKVRQEQQEERAIYSHLKTLKTPDQLIEEARIAKAATATEDTMAPQPANKGMTVERQAAIINLANSNGFDVATLKRQADQTLGKHNDEVVISLH